MDTGFINASEEPSIEKAKIREIIMSQVNAGFCNAVVLIVLTPFLFLPLGIWKAIELIVWVARHLT